MQDYVSPFEETIGKNCSHWSQRIVGYGQKYDIARGKGLRAEYRDRTDAKELGTVLQHLCIASHHSPARHTLLHQRTSQGSCKGAGSNHRKRVQPPRVLRWYSHRW